MINSHLKKINKVRSKSGSKSWLGSKSGLGPWSKSGSKSWLGSKSGLGPWSWSESKSGLGSKSWSESK